MGQDEAQKTTAVEEAQPLLDKDDVDVVVPFFSGFVMLFVKFHFYGSPLFHRLNPDVGGIPDHHIKPAPVHHLGELRLPVEGVHPVDLLIVEEGRLAIVEVGGDQGVPALDVTPKVGQSPLLEELKLL